MLDLPSVTLCCIDTRYPGLAEESLHRSSVRAGIRYGAVVLFTTAAQAGFARRHDFALEVEPIAGIGSKIAYSRFLIEDLPARIRTEYVLITQWDSFVIDASAWSPTFLEFDYIGAPWPWLPPPRVGNGGFSLRSSRLLELAPGLVGPVDDNEDVILCRRARNALESRGIRYADERTASRFAFERAAPVRPVFGFHGLFNFHKVLPAADLAATIEDLPAPLALTIEGAELAFHVFNAGARDLGRAIVGKRLREQPGDVVGRDFARQMWSATDPCWCGSGVPFGSCHPPG